VSGTEVTPSPAPVALAHLNDLDRLLAELDHPDGRAALKRLGLETPGMAKLRLTREKLLGALDPRWRYLYERLVARYPRPIAAVRAQVCTGCFVTLPPTARARAHGDGPPICQGCGRILLWV
jgi:predicted  nucleic acid-binding Zn-ribbon protein